ncbi:methylthioribulose-1-phosphate dehydratase [Methylohalomonas lacus]|uniref:Methylthioribulose-1-phosphate dehydratase n=1 Tax=Methylohalomonas lacus TaxID=398773 RepID=A0AAE3HNP5_9GAMM|nr:methylthioribulose 1-phosphate dehydratase [Methylohalomonas lacus]MCS3904037.1 methylthioribulose-1-phosphate dehydratase [Methylohalomonas lacus]
MTQDFEQAARALADAGRQLYQLGMVPATSGNFSARLDAERIAITVSGRHKGHLSADDIMLVDGLGQSLDGRRASAETALHIQIYQRFGDAGAVLHPHSVHATLLSRLLDGPLELSDYELLKAFPGFTTHESHLTVPVFNNDQDIDRLAAEVDAWMDSAGPIHGYLIRGHGFYTWGGSVADAMRHVEAFEFLFKCELMLQGVSVQ